MGTQKIVFGEHTVEIRTEFIDVTSNLPQPDPAWTFTDTAGHAHAYAADGADHYPTLISKYGEVEWCNECEDTHADYLGMFCRQCDEKIRPGTRTVFGRQYIRGRQEALIDGEPATIEQAEALAEEWRASRG
jgi:hypothetical protein